MVYGRPLSLPGELVSGSVDRNVFASTKFVQDLRQRMADTIQPPVFFHAKKSDSVPLSIPKSLLESPYIFVLRGPRPSPLATPYEGPFQVLEAGDKFFLLNIHGQDTRISIDRLKPARGFLLP